jgi:trk system potassium uptake protein TrkH
MHITIVAKVIGMLLMIFSVLGNFPPLLVSLIYNDGVADSFAYSMACIFIVGFLLWSITARYKKELGNRDGCTGHGGLLATGSIGRS